MSINVAIDLHGTYDEYPNQFDSIMRELIQKHGIQFWIFSGSRQNKIEDYLKIHSRTNTDDFKFVYPRLQYLSIVDFCFDQKLPMIQKSNPKTGNPSWYFDGDEQIWWAMKSIICKKMNINILIDDKPQYNAFFGFPHPTLCYVFNSKDIQALGNVRDFILEYIEDPASTKVEHFRYMYP